MSAVDQYVRQAEAMLDAGPHSKDSVRRTVIASAAQDEGVEAREVHEALDRLFEKRREAAA